VSRAGRQFLIVDADDTLWENNIYFERAFDEFFDFLDHSTLSPAAVRAVVDEIEAVNAKVHGYGSANFGRNMQQAYRHLAERQIDDTQLQNVMSIAERIMQQPIELIEGVEGTLEYLSSRHDLTLFTKGHPEEQKLKIDRSGLGVYFGHTAIVKEKDAGAYRALARDRGMDPARAWMIGNSPRSDINPALAAGLGAVFIPHANTWILENEEIRAGASDRFLALETFSDLRNHF
jgi:putative hydrolase of the HAD superfamily